MRAFLSDLGYATRSLRQHPAFAITAIVTLALGIGASTAIFGVVNAVLLQPLPYGNADRLVVITQDLRVRGVTDFAFAPGDVADIRNDATLLDGVAAINTTKNAPLGPVGSAPEPIVVASATTNIFDVLQVPVALGRNFTANDGMPQPPRDPAAAPTDPPSARLPLIGILGYDFWQRKYGGDRSMVGKNVMLFGSPVQIVGIASPRAQLLLPPNMNVPPSPDLWVAMRVNFEGAQRLNSAFRLIARVKPGANLTAVRAQISRISADIAVRFPIFTTGGRYMRVEPMKQYLVAGVRTPILALMGAVVFVLLIACANVANLLLVRAAQRERELAVRSAIGGSPWSIVRQLLAESLVLATVAALAGIALAEVGVSLLVRLTPGNLPRLLDVSIDLRVLAFAVGASFAAAILFGLVPALRASRPDLAQVLRASGRTPSLGGASRLRNGVIVAEVALSFVLLIGSGLMIRSFSALLHTDPGFDSNGVLTFAVGNFHVRSRDELAGFVRQLHDRLAAIPGVIAVTAANAIPLDGQEANIRWGTQAALADPTRFRQGEFMIVAPGYFEAMQTRLIAGRAFTSADDVPAATGVIIDDALAKAAFGNEPAVGKTVLARVHADVNRPFFADSYTVIGVVKHERHSALSGDELPGIYFPSGMIGVVLPGRWVVRTTGDPAALAAAVRRTIAALDPQVLITEMQPMTEWVDKAMAPTRFALVLIGIFAAIAALLAAVGLYGVLSSVVRQRTSEIGIRMAFGAPSASIFRLVIGHGLRLSGVGIVLGLVIALAATRVMASMLIGVRPTDPATFAVMAVVFLAVATVACWVPAWRAAGLDPNTALREE